MHFVSEQLTFQEIPEEICLSYMIVGCPLRCPGCHSSELWSKSQLNSNTRLNTTTQDPMLSGAKKLSPEYLSAAIEKNKDFFTCVLFLGGEWHAPELLELLKLTKNQNLKTALYTGLESVDNEIYQQLDYLKTGPWIQKLGGLKSSTTNQKLIHVPTQTQIYLNKNQLTLTS